MQIVKPASHKPVFRDFVLDAAADWQTRGERVALATLVEIDGSGPRPLGSQMVVSETGTALGFLSGGCVEQAIIDRARQALAERRPALVGYGGEDSAIDLRLPCGSRIAIAFTPDPPHAELSRLLDRRAARRPSRLAIGKGTALFALSEDGAPVPEPAYLKPLEPPWRLIVAGDGPILEALCRFALALEYEVIALTGDEATAAGAQALGAETRIGHVGALTAALSLDAWSGFVTVFHDHDKEERPLAHALRSDVAYLGALGSRATHERRCTGLRAAGWDSAAIARISAPVGLDIGARTPAEIALSVLAELTARRRLPAGIAVTRETGP